MSITGKSDIQLISIKIFNNQEVDIKLDVFHFDENVKIDEIDTENLIYILIPFINNYNDNLEDFIKFIMNINLFSAVRDDSLEIIDSLHYNKTFIQNTEYGFDHLAAARRILKEEPERSDLIYITKFTKYFKYEFIDWNDRNELLEILKYCFFKALLLERSRKRLKSLEEREDIGDDGSPRKMEVYKIMPCGHVQNIYNENPLLTRRLKPTMSMDEFSRIAKEDMEIREKKTGKANNKEITENSRESSDDMKEYNQNFRGNTKNIG